MSNVQVTFGVNDMTLELAGQSLATVKHSLKSVLGLSGNEEVRVNGSAPERDYIIREGDEIEFVKTSGRKGAVQITAGVNDMSLAVEGKTVGTVRSELGSMLGINRDWRAQVNGEDVNDNYILETDDDLEFVKASGSKGAVQITAGVNDMSLAVEGKTVGTVRSELGSMLGINGDWRAQVNGENVSDSYILEDDDDLEFVKASGSKG